MNTWVIISITLVFLIIVTITILILTRQSILTEGSPFPTSTIKITNSSMITFNTIRCYDTDGNIYTPIQGLSTPRLFTPQDNFIVNMKNQTSLLCIAMTDTTRYITILGNDTSNIYFIYSNTDKNMFTFSNTSQLPVNVSVIKNTYNGTIHTPTINSKPLLIGDSFPVSSIILTNCVSDSITLTEFINIDNPGNLNIGTGLSSLPITAPIHSSCILYGTINTTDQSNHILGIALYNKNGTVGIINIGINGLIISRPYELKSN